MENEIVLFEKCFLSYIMNITARFLMILWQKLNLVCSEG